MHKMSRMFITVLLKIVSERKQFRYPTIDYINTLVYFVQCSNNQQKEKVQTTDSCKTWMRL
jgi:hypothetical protein